MFEAHRYFLKIDGSGTSLVNEGKFSDFEAGTWEGAKVKGHVQKWPTASYVLDHMGRNMNQMIDNTITFQTVLHSNTKRQ